MTDQDPLQRLFVTESQAVDKQQLADLLSPYVTINKETKSLDFSRVFNHLSNAEKILIVLSAVKAMSLYLGTEDKIVPSDIIKMDIMPLGSVKGTLKKLLDSREIRADKGKYSLPNYKIPQLVVGFSNQANK